MNKTDALHEGLKKMLNYLPMIYNQRQTNAVWNGNFIIRYPYDSIPENAILFMLPIYSSLDNSTSININKLTIQYATVSQDGKQISYQNSKTYNIVVEELDGSKRPAKVGDIVANRLCMFRFITNNKTDIILCNDCNHNNLACTSLYVTTESTFKELPIYEYIKLINGVPTTIRTYLSTQEDIANLNDRLTALENKFHIGTQSPEDFFEENSNLPDDSIYFQTEE